MRRIPLILSALVSATSAQAVPVQWTTGAGGNGHFYEIVTNQTSFWSAETTAAARSHNGISGHLVTITSAAEQSFLNGLNPGGTDLWIGASDAALEGDWRWIAGPETGQKLDTGYTNWWNNEPNQWRGKPENYAVGWWGSGWNDIPGTANFGYVIEYSAPAEVPLPASGGLVIAALGLLALYRRRTA